MAAHSRAVQVVSIAYCLTALLEASQEHQESTWWMWQRISPSRRLGQLV
jgi:hypothetical protein